MRHLNGMSSTSLATGSLALHNGIVLGLQRGYGSTWLSTCRSRNTHLNMQHLCMLLIACALTLALPSAPSSPEEVACLTPVAWPAAALPCFLAVLPRPPPGKTRCCTGTMRSPTPDQAHAALWRVSCLRLVRAARRRTGSWMRERLRNGMARAL